MGAAVVCPVCETRNAPGEVWCAECGFQLGAVPGEAVAPEVSGPPAELATAGGETFALQYGANTIGRQDASVLLKDPTVSRKHAKITVSDGGIALEDLGSSNGSFVDGARVPSGETASLRNGAEIVFGSFGVTLLDRRDEAGEPHEDAVEDLAPEAETPETAGPTLELSDGTVVPLPEGALRIGRRAGNDLVLSDAYVSGSHAQILREGVSVCVADQSSTNGTFLNGVRLNPGERAPLKNGDRVRFGNTETTYRSGADSRVEDSWEEGSAPGNIREEDAASENFAAASDLPGAPEDSEIPESESDER
jgi:pSer/pThr/pTyr-binding forkhead associated (FHA) protein